MFVRRMKYRCSSVLVSLVISIAGMSTALADQVTLIFIDTEANAQTLSVDVDSFAADLALAASLMAEDGVGISHDPNIGSGTLAEIAAALAAAAPTFAAEIADALASMSPQDSEAIVAAINAVPGVNVNAVRAAVHFGSDGRKGGPQPPGSDSTITLDLTQVEPIPSRN